MHGKDDFELLRRTPRLSAIGDLIAALEDEHGIAFDRSAPLVRSSFGSEGVIAAWARTL